MTENWKRIQNLQSSTTAFRAFLSKTFMHYLSQPMQTHSLHILHNNLSSSKKESIGLAFPAIMAEFEMQIRSRLTADKMIAGRINK